MRVHPYFACTSARCIVVGKCFKRYSRKIPLAREHLYLPLSIATCIQSSPKCPCVCPAVKQVEVVIHYLARHLLYTLTGSINTGAVGIKHALPRGGLFPKSIGYKVSHAPGPCN